MSLKQRRDHKPEPGRRPAYCRFCGDRIAYVFGFGVPDYWRHWRRSDCA